MYERSTLTLKVALNEILTFETISHTKRFVVHSVEGHYICQATAWNSDWIGGIATPGTSDDIGTYSFIRFVSRGADTVLKKLGRPEVRYKTYSGKPGTSNPSITFSVEGPVIFAGITSVSYTVYSWGENFNHYANSRATCTWSENTITVSLSGGNNVSGDRDVEVTVYYICD